MDWRKRSRRRPAFHDLGHAHELTFSCYRRYAFLQAERTCQTIGEKTDIHPLARLAKELDEGSEITVLPEHGEAPVASIEHMVAIATLRSARGSWHAGH